MSRRSKKWKKPLPEGFPKWGRGPYWDRWRCRREAKKYDRLIDFIRYSQVAYRKAVAEGWIDGYVWLKRRVKWNKEKVMEVARRYDVKSEFIDNNIGAYMYAVRHGFVGEMDWFIEWTKEMEEFRYRLFGKVYHMLLSVGVSATREWLLLESGKEDVYGYDERRLMRSWSRRVTARWASLKRKCWYLYPDMDWSKGRDIWEADDELHIKP